MWNIAIIILIWHDSQDFVIILPKRVTMLSHLVVGVFEDIC